MTIDSLLSAPLRSNGADYVLLRFIYLFNFFIQRLFSETTRPILTKYLGIVYSGVIWIIRCTFKILLTPSRGENAENSKNLVTIHGLTQIFNNNFKTVEDNSNLKQTWTREIVSQHFRKISLWMVRGQLRFICPIEWQNLYLRRLLLFC